MTIRPSTPGANALETQSISTDCILALRISRALLAPGLVMLVLRVKSGFDDGFDDTG